VLEVFNFGLKNLVLHFCQAEAYTGYSKPVFSDGYANTL
jgi:hypothetical protein